MTDVHTPEVRSYNMSRIRSKNTRPELLVRKYLFAKGLRYRLNDSSLPGKPDMVFPKYNTVIFIHGCFWHGHEGCKYFVVPKTKTDWWLNKIQNTSLRDVEVQAQIADKGWSFITVFECELKPGKREQTLTNLLNHLKQ